MTRRRIGLTQRVEDLPDRNERRDALDQQWAVLLDDAGLVPVAIPNLLGDPAAFVDDNELDLLILTGGNDLSDLPGAVNTAPERDQTEATLLDLAIARRIPVLGVCRGLQMMVTHAGGRLQRVSGHAGTTHGLEPVGGEADWPLRAAPVNSFHDWGLDPDALGGYQPLAAAPDGTIEAVCHPHLPHVGIMWHPERGQRHPDDLEIIRALLER